MSIGNALQNKTTLLERYQIKSWLGENGLSISYKAYDTLREKNCVIKELFPSTIVRRSMDDKEGVELKQLSYEELFIQMKEHVIKQAKELIKLYPLEGIANVITFFEENHTIYIVSEYIEGIPLSKYLQKRKDEKLELAAILHFFSPMTDSLQILHEHHVYHGKIRPNQIIITKKNGVKLIGFGDPMEDLAHDVFKDDVFTARDSHYSSVEQFMKEGVLGSQTDVYGLAATIYHCITRCEPMEFYARIGKKDRMQTPIECGANISIKQNAAIMKGLAPFDFERYQTIEELLYDIYAGVEDTNFSDYKPIVVYQAPFKFVLKQRMRKLIIGATATVGAILILMLLVKAVGFIGNARVHHFYKKFAKSSLYEQCETLKWLGKDKRAKYTNDYSQMGEDEELEVIYYDLMHKKMVGREEFMNRGKLFEFVEINYRADNFVIYVLYDREQTKTITVDLNNLGEAYDVTERVEQKGKATTNRVLKVDENSEY